MSRVFKIDDFTITIEDALFEEACRVYVLEDENNLIASDSVEECKNSNYFCLKQMILAAFRTSLDLEELKKITHEYVRCNFNDEEISKAVSNIIISEIETNGGEYDIEI